MVIAGIITGTSLGIAIHAVNTAVSLQVEMWELEKNIDELMQIYENLFSQVQDIKRVVAVYNPGLAEEVAIEIIKAAMQNNLDPMLICSIIAAESSFNMNAASKKGAIGLMQLMPATAAMLGVDPHDWKQNIAGGTRYLKTLIDRFGHIETALAAYNAGPARISRGAWPGATRMYVSKVITMQSRGQGQ